MHNKRSSGFTLIELMIVVAIIGILAAIAIPNFIKFQLKAKTSEVKSNLAAIRTAEESYYAEYGTYVSALPSPAAIGHNVKVDFLNEAGAGEGFDRVGWSPEGKVWFNYSVASNAAEDEYTAGAVADIDNDDSPQTWGYTTDGSVDAQTHVDGTCDVTGLTAKTVMPCEPQSGQSVF